jgi:hypothetical protein
VGQEVSYLLSELTLLALVGAFSSSVSVAFTATENLLQNIGSAVRIDVSGIDDCGLACCTCTRGDGRCGRGLEGVGFRIVSVLRRRALKFVLDRPYSPPKLPVEWGLD